MHGRRSFLKRLGAVVAGLSLQNKLSALAEKKQAQQYPRKFKENSLPPLRSGMASSGCFLVSITGSYCCSGVYNPAIRNDYPSQEHFPASDF